MCAYCIQYLDKKKLQAEFLYLKYIHTKTTQMPESLKYKKGKNHTSFSPKHQVVALVEDHVRE